jgi:hypothetical protein
MVLVIGACSDDSAKPPQAPDLPEPSSPANVLLALEEIYEDSSIDPAERARSYAALLAPPPGNPDLPAFTFRFGMCDIECPWREWGYTEEVEVHETMFRRVHRIELDLNPGEELDYFPGEFPDLNGWKIITSNNVRIRVWLNETEVVEKRPGLQSFIFAPVGDRWYLAAWREERSSAMWGDLKSEFAVER